MPSKSLAQHRFMAFIANGGKVKDGPTQAQAQEFMEADRGRKFVPHPRKRGRSSAE